MAGESLNPIDWIGNVAHTAKRIYRWDAAIEHRRNQQMILTHQLQQAGLSPRDAVTLSELLASTPDPTLSASQSLYTDALKHLGYLSHQAQ